MDELELRRALGHFATGVTVVTTTTAAGEPHGLTVNAFASLSLDPPQVIVCLKHENRSYPAFALASHFAVNMLAEDQVDLSRLFASDRERKFDGIAYQAGERSGAPLLDGAHAWLECEVAGRVEVVGTHIVVIGALLRYDLRGAPPLLFHRGRYHRLGGQIT